MKTPPLPHPVNNAGSSTSNGPAPDRAPGNGNKGRKLTPEHIEKLRLSHIGKKRVPAVTVACERCGKPTEYKFPCRARRFCSHACANQQHWETRPRGQMESRQCITCSKDIPLLASTLRVRERFGQQVKFCSRECMGIAMRKPEHYFMVCCATCGKEQEIGRRPKNGLYFCSRKCAGISRRVTGAKWRDKNQIKTYMTNYYKANRDRSLELSRRWAAGNRQKKLAIQKKYRQTNPRMTQMLERARKHAVQIGSFTRAEWEDIKKRYDYRCLCCTKREPVIKLEADHVIPLKLGGPHVAENIQPLCRSCNSKKSAKAIDYRLRSHARC